MIHRCISKVILLFFFVCFFVVSYAQVPQGINYQAIARDAGGNPIPNSNVSVGIRIIQDATTVYTEIHAATTNTFGLINLVIGTGTTTDVFSDIDWSIGTYSIDLSIDGENVGQQDFQSVPFALHCATADALSGGGSTITASNGLTKTGDDVELGGVLDKTVEVDMNGYEVYFNGGNEFIVDANIIEFRESDGTFTMGVESGAVIIGGTANNGLLRYRDGNQGLNKVLTSDASGLATWQTPLSSPWLVSGTKTYYNDGNVGIGSVFGSSKVYIFDAAEPTLTLTSDTSGFSNLANSGTIELLESPGPFATAGNYGFRMKYEGTQNKFLLQSCYDETIHTAIAIDRGTATLPGNVGIGTTTPTSTLDVNGQIRIRGGNPGIGKVLVSDVTGVGQWVNLSNYFTRSGLNDGSTANVGTTWTQLDIDPFTITKANNESTLEVNVNTRISLGTFTGGVTGVQFQVRIGTNTPSGGNDFVSIHTASAVSFLTAFCYFRGLASGSYNVTIWARTTVGTVSSVLLDPGGWAGNITVKESY